MAYRTYHISELMARAIAHFSDPLSAAQAVPRTDSRPGNQGGITSWQAEPFLPGKVPAETHGRLPVGAAPGRAALPAPAGAAPGKSFHP